eukprot:jgi/Botrbrau1/4463/Bobra.0348s0046.1
MSKRRSLSMSQNQGSGAPQKQRFAIRSTEVDIQENHPKLQGPSSSLAASVKTLLQTDSKPVRGSKMAAVVDEVSFEQVSEEILDDSQEGEAEARQFATPPHRGPQYRATASCNNLLDECDTRLQVPTGQSRGIAAQQQFLANIFATAGTPINSPFGRSGESIPSDALGPQLQRLRQEDKSYQIGAPLLRKHAPGLELICLASKVDGHLQMWWCRVCSSAKGGNDELLLLVSNAAFIQELSEGMHIGLYRPYDSITAGNVRVLLVPGEASVCLL